MEAISQIGISGRQSLEGSVRDLSSYRSNAVPSRVIPPRSVPSSTRAFTDIVGVKITNGVTNGVADGVAPVRDNFFRKGSNKDGNVVGSGSVNNSVASTGSLFSGVAAEHREAALSRVRGVFSERFIDKHPIFSPAPRALPSTSAESLSSGLSLPTGELRSVGSRGELSSDLLRALQRYRVAAEQQG